MTSHREFIASAVLALSLAACGPPPNLPPTLGSAKPSPRAESPGALVTVDGEVMGVDRVPPGDTLATGVSVTVGPGGSEPLDIHLAPRWYLDERGLSLAEHDRIRVLGSPRIRMGRTTVVAWEVRKGGEVYRLRDGRGRPLWDPKAR